ncbi:hypothetical protein J6590_054625 [Homalodisca vitripennis]|nr:hypothetical protein J6590_100014 [Homalodisca vitripennis]KAG8276912.1 hypothetical protein J6590_054625 [Homalodisca vitripennis]
MPARCYSGLGLAVINLLGPSVPYRGQFLKRYSKRSVCSRHFQIVPVVSARVHLHAEIARILFLLSHCFVLSIARWQTDEITGYHVPLNGFSDDSDIGDLSDEDDPTFVIPPRIDDALQDDEDDDNDEGAAGINDDFEVLVFDQPSGNWEVTEIFDPLPPAPPFEGDITDPEYVSSKNGWRRPL